MECGVYIGPEGPTNARIAIVGEKPGRDEVRLKRPFVGVSGRELNQLLLKVGTNRSNVYVTNTVKTVDDFTTPTRQDIEREQFSLYKELSALPNLSVIVPMGAVALQALTNFQLDTIGNYRGSILSSFIGTKMVPTYHPAFYMRGEWRMKPIVAFDLGRALEESSSPAIQLPQRKFYIAEKREDLRAIEEELTNRVQYISFDIELMRGRYIECIAFSKNPYEAFCIPITNGKRTPYWEPKDEVLAWQTIHNILNKDGVKYVAKNGLFDCWHLWRHGIPTRMENGYDVEYMHRLRAPDLPHDLGFLVSIYTREPYYKDESGHWEDQNRSVSDDQFYGYNCKDAATTLECLYALMEDMESTGQLEYYEKEVHNQWYAVTDMRQRGIKTDHVALRNVREIISKRIDDTNARIEKRLGWRPNTKSWKDMEKLYIQCGITYSRTPKGQPKKDKEILYTYAAKNPQWRDVLLDIQAVNEDRTLRSGFLGLKTDDLGFYHPELIINKAKSGRLASRGADEGGPQIQNIPKALRIIFTADDPLLDELTNADLKGAEAMLLAWFTQDPLLIGSFREGKDIHRVRGCMIYRGWRSLELPPDELLASIKKVCEKCAILGEAECNHAERYMAKQSGHAMAYLEGIRRFVQEQRKKGIFIEEGPVKAIRDIVVTKFIRNWHTNVELSLKHKPWLTNPLGRKREFYGLLDQTMLREALSWLCQSTVGQIASRAMVYLAQELREIPHARIITQTHDSVTSTHRKADRDRIVALYHSAFHCPMVINGEELVIPIDIKHGANWREV